MIIVETLLLLAVLAAIGYPIFAGQKAPAESIVDDGDERHKLVSAKESAFVALKDLEFDYKTGKIDDGDYDMLKNQYEAEAVAILKKIDSAERVSSPGGAAVFAKPSGTGEKKAGVAFCPSCGNKVGKNDRFCSGCGAPLGKD
jgi:hypothetical protein